MYRIPVSSSNLRSVGYDSTLKILEIEFHSGGIYRYSNVAESVYRGLMSASSHGQYFQQHIKKVYAYQRVG